MQTSPLSPIPAPLPSGRGAPPARSGSAPTPIRLLIGDGDREFRRTLRASLAADPRIEVVGEADDGALALQLLRRLRPDVALLDEDLPSFGGAAIARVIRSELPDTRVVVMTGLAGCPAMKPEERSPEMDFYGTVVNEIRQPLTSTGEVQRAKRFLDEDPSRAGEALDQVASQIIRIDRLLVQLRDRARDAAHAEALFKR